MKKGAKNPNAGRKQWDGKPHEVVIQKLETAWAMGCPDIEAAAYADVSCAALCAYLKNHPEISERKEKLLQKPFLAARNAILKKISEGDADLALRYMERKKRAEFSTLQQVEVSEQAPYRGLTDEQLAQIASGKAKPSDFIK